MARHIEHQHEILDSPRNVPTSFATDKSRATQNTLSTYTRTLEEKRGQPSGNAILKIHRGYGIDQNGLFVPDGYGVGIRAAITGKEKQVPTIEEFHKKIAQLGGFTVAVSGNTLKDPSKNLIVAAGIRWEGKEATMTHTVNQVNTAPTLEEILDSTFRQAIKTHNELNVSALQITPAHANEAMNNARAADANVTLRPVYTK